VSTYLTRQDLEGIDLTQVSIAVQKMMLPGVTKTPIEVYEDIAPAVATAARQYTHVAPKIDWAIDHWPLFVVGSFAAKVALGMFTFWLFVRVIGPRMGWIK